MDKLLVLNLINLKIKKKIKIKSSNFESAFQIPKYYFLNSVRFIGGHLNFMLSYLANYSWNKHVKENFIFKKDDSNKLKYLQMHVERIINHLILDFHTLEQVHSSTL